ncbi:protein translocase subunit SecD [Methylococcus sp. EFPC2]|uniref:protein translocase subunit SecD n=1 Tax=Methylococcus sp. EFPC2 TaxID=2812648 RepID=UPI001968084C|nr:protein translocase subunit SecD [Methylococcus sp. EFPC2]QSA95619.1 protein translocase subunit SecD [Methylococcus sp. EFPC2]
MRNSFPVWKNILVISVLALAFIYSLPNFFGENPSVQLSPSRTAKVDQSTVVQVDKLLADAGLKTLKTELSDKRLLVRFADEEAQLKAADVLKVALGDNYTVALNLAPATPSWLRAINAQPMYLGLDLRGGVHFLLQVDMPAAIQQAEERYAEDIRTLLRDNKIRYLSVEREKGVIEVKFQDGATLGQGRDVVKKELRGLALDENAGDNLLVAKLGDPEVREIRKNAVSQNIITLRNRVNELGVAEPVIQQQGEDRIVVQLPGVQDTARAKEILGATATLEFRLVDSEHSIGPDGKAPLGSRVYRDRAGKPILLQRKIIVTGDQVVDASSGLEQQSGSSAVFINLNSVGAKKMADTTKDNIGKAMAVVFIENKQETKEVNGQKVVTKKTVEEVINVATIRDRFSKRFQITGLDSSDEARNLALLLRAGALVAPVDIVEERTVGPSMGKENIEIGVKSNVYGFAAIAIFMIVYYRVFGIFSVVALGVNVLLLVSALSLIQATLTLPGLAGIALTVGMAIDANVLINERIREELRAGISPQMAIYAGYERAFATILDSNVTTFVAGLALFILGSGPIRGFALVLLFGILTSMFSAVLVSRFLVNLTYGRQRKLNKLAI